MRKSSLLHLELFLHLEQTQSTELTLLGPGWAQRAELPDFVNIEILSFKVHFPVKILVLFKLPKHLGLEREQTASP